jgi:uncharacterized membrane protein
LIEFKTQSQIIYLYIIIHLAVLSFIFLQSFLKNYHFYCCKNFELKVSFDRSNPDPYLVFFSHLYYIFLFLFGLLIFAVKLNTLIVWFIVHIVERTMMLINVYHRGQILNTSIGVGYDILVACTFFVDETISIYYLKRWIHVGLNLLPSHFNIIISARINTAPPGSSVFL